MGGEAVLDVYLRPMSSVEFEDLVKRKKPFYSSTNTIRIDNIEYSRYQDVGKVYLTINGQISHELWLIKKDNSWHVGAYNIAREIK